MIRAAAGIVFALLLLAAAQSQQQKVFQLAPGVYFWQGDTTIRRPANCTWILFKDYVVVIDANFPWGAREILPEIRKTTTLPIRFVFNTHYHADHAFGSALFKEAGATIVCSRACGVESRTKGEADWRNQVLNRAQSPNASEHDKAVAAETIAKGYRLEHPTLLFDERMAFDDGERRLELIRMGPAHSLGDAVAYLPKEKILVTGDLCVNWTSGNNVGDKDADHANWIRALDTLATWDANIVIPGHGRPGATQTLQGQRAYLADMLDQVRAGIRAGKTADQLAGEIDLSRHQPFGARPSAGSVRVVYRKLTESRKAGVPE
jgi:glyoxylase-like metal-dependent hydrolase (beta-lactamase superfamily II)